jgi:ABC-type amino acid transport substrate-binding protein
MALHPGLRWLSGFAGAFALIASAATAGAQAIDPAVLAQLAPTGKLRVGVAAGLTPGTGNVAIAPGAERPQGIGADLGAASVRVPELG